MSGEQLHTVSVVIATFNRPALLRELLDDLHDQQLPGGWSLEVVVVDDGSDVPAAPALADHPLGPRLQVLRQANAGPAAARHRAIMASRGSTTICLDDDMRVDPDFVARHLRCHAEGAEVVLGRIDDASDGTRRPLFHRLHQRYLDAKVVDVDGAPARGVGLFTGNVSFRTARYHEVGGFDVTLRRCEDRDLGIRLELAGSRIVSAPSAAARHCSDHADVAGWRRRSTEWGRLDQGIADRHGEAVGSPWQVLRKLPAPFAPVALGAAVAPRAFTAVAANAYRAGQVLERAGLEGPALQAAAVTYAVDYFRGVGLASSSRRAVLRGARRAQRHSRTAAAPSAAAPSATATAGTAATTSVPNRMVRAEPSPAFDDALDGVGPWRRFVASVRADHATSRHYRARYQGATASSWRLPFDALTKVGFQMLVAIRFMRLVRDLRVPLGPQLVSRMIRHLYSAEIHWHAEIAPGVAIVHGNGLVLSADARVGARCILFQHVTLGRSVDGASGATGAPTLASGVHVGPGAVLLGPIVVGERTKIVANSVITTDIPAGVVVRPAPVELTMPRLHAVDDDEQSPAHGSGRPGPSATPSEPHARREQRR